MARNKKRAPKKPAKKPRLKLVEGSQRGIKVSDKYLARVALSPKHVGERFTELMEGAVSKLANAKGSQAAMKAARKRRAAVTEMAKGPREVWQDGEGWWHSTEDDGMEGPFDTYEEALERFRMYGAVLNLPKGVELNPDHTYTVEELEEIARRVEEDARQ